MFPIMCTLQSLEDNPCTPTEHMLIADIPANNTRLYVVFPSTMAEFNNALMTLEGMTPLRYSQVQDILSHQRIIPHDYSDTNSFMQAFSVMEQQWARNDLGEQHEQ